MNRVVAEGLMNLLHRSNGGRRQMQAEMVDDYRQTDIIIIPQSNPGAKQTARMVNSLQWIILYIPIYIS